MRVFVFLDVGCIILQHAWRAYQIANSFYLHPHIHVLPQLPSSRAYIFNKHLLFFIFIFANLQTYKTYPKCIIYQMNDLFFCLFFLLSSARLAPSRSFPRSASWCQSFRCGSRASPWAGARWARGDQYGSIAREGGPDCWTTCAGENGGKSIIAAFRATAARRLKEAKTRISASRIKTRAVAVNSIKEKKSI